MLLFCKLLNKRSIRFYEMQEWLIDINLAIVDLLTKLTLKNAQDYCHFRSNYFRQFLKK